jgi:uncharacterized protein
MNAMPIKENLIISEYSMIQIKFQSKTDKYANRKTITIHAEKTVIAAETSAKFLVKKSIIACRPMRPRSAVLWCCCLRREDYGEDRFIIIGMVEGRLLSDTMRGKTIRIISARGAKPHEQWRYHEDNT